MADNGNVFECEIDRQRVAFIYFLEEKSFSFRLSFTIQTAIFREDKINLSNLYSAVN